MSTGSLISRYFTATSISKCKGPLSREFPSSCAAFYSTKSREILVDDVPYAKQLPLIKYFFPIELMLKGGGEKLHEFIDNRHKLLGPIFREQLGPVASVFVSDSSDIRKIFASEGKYPKHVLPEAWLLYNKVKNYKRGLYFMDGEEWFECRKALNSIVLKDFHISPAVDDFFTKYFESWIQNLKDREIMDLEKRLYNLSIIFMVFFLMGDSFIAHAKLFTPLAEKLASVVSEIFYWSVKMSTVPANLAKMCGFAAWKQFVAAVDESIKISRELLELIIRLGRGNGIIRDLIDDGISEGLIRGIVVDFIMAAGDTTATASQWALYELGSKKDFQEQLYLELKEQDDYKKVSLLKNTIKESMRLYPVAPFIARYLPDDTRIGNYTIKAGELVSMSMFTCSRSEKYFTQANEFNPNRWNRWKEIGHYKLVADPYATLPYGIGSRSCIGQKMAQTQLITTIGKILSMYELRTIEEVGIKLNLITVPSKPIRLRIKKRS